MTATRQPVPIGWGDVPEGFYLLWEYDPTIGMNFFRVKFTMTLEQAITDEMLSALSISEAEIWGPAIRELESSIIRRFRR